MSGAAFGKYTLVCKLATGGMGELFVARRAGAGGFEKLVVIKRLLPHLAEDAHFVAMLLDEARVAARLSHPNVCQVYDLGEVDGHYYMAMEHLEGIPASLILRRASRAGQRLDLGLATAILRQAADGLHHAHDLRDSDGNSVGLVHRDVSPSNLFVTATGVVKVLDFGVAKSQDALARTHTGALKGKYAYMSPEQVLGQPVDRRSDVWSLGIVLYELLTAQRLFWRDSEYKMFQAILDEPIPPLGERRPGLPPRVVAVAERALSRDPALRQGSAREMSEALEEAMAGAGGVWRPGRVGDYVNEHFGALMEERRRDVQSGLSGKRRAGEEDVETTAETAAEEQLGPDDFFIDVETGTGRARREGGLRSWLGGLALLAALGGGGVFAWRQWMPQPVRQPTRVVVEGGEVETLDGEVTRVAGPPPVPAAAPAVEPVAEEPPVVRASAPVARQTAADPYSAALAQHQDAIRRCFNEGAEVAALEVV
ncbi:MAG TPA: serine/threonine-protein kinase, partial [Kofleriaceae bacterium]|nr:serine/threonine-protein kinase [Kofleriaceae bacterium]